MDSGTDSRHVGNHLLGPHVVGQRVVVRRVLRGETGPSGGPAMTDVLGVCTAWGDGRCVVAPEAGPPVEIAIADIVSGKPVPPRPSVRHRVSTRDAEEHTLSLFAGLETERLGDWVLRTVPVLEGRLVKRANSCLAIGDPGLDADRGCDADPGVLRDPRPPGAGPGRGRLRGRQRALRGRLDRRTRG